MARQLGIEIFIFSINTINYAVKKYTDSNIEIVLKGKILVNLFSKLFLDYHSYIDIFLISELNKFLLYWNYNYTINLEPRTKPHYRSLHRMSRNKLLILKKYLENNLHKEFIWISTLLVVSSILFTKKPDDSLRFCVNYWKFNVITIKNYYPIFLI